jgi:uroporphyrin-III C-methyltransferase
MGKVYLVGAGPGAPDLLTLRAARLLEARTWSSMTRWCIRKRWPSRAARAGSTSASATARSSTDQRFINRALVEAARTHEVVVRLKGGDPMLFGRAQEELEALEAAGIACEVVPGVTAALAAAPRSHFAHSPRAGANRRLPDAARGRGESPSAWVPAALHADTALLYMAAGASQAIATALIEAGKPAPPRRAWSRAPRSRMKRAASRRSPRSPPSRSRAPRVPS